MTSNGQFKLNFVFAHVRVRSCTRKALTQTETRNSGACLKA